MAKLKRGDRTYNRDTNEWEVKKPKDKPTPASNTRKKMKAKASEEPKKAPEKKRKPAAKKEAPAVPKRRPDSKPPVKGVKPPVKGVMKVVPGRDKRDVVSPAKGGTKRGSAKPKSGGAKGRPKGFSTKKYKGPFK